MGTMVLPCRVRRSRPLLARSQALAGPPSRLSLHARHMLLHRLALRGHQLIHLVVFLDRVVQSVVSEDPVPEVVREV
jgi:hypothetical protein